jgi:glucose/arabinose dehydrogenase
MQAAAFLVLAACGSAPTQSSAQSSGERPFTASPVATFESPWAMDFLPGSGVRMTNMALVTEKPGKLWLVDVSNGQKREVAGVPKVHVQGQGGLAEVVVHPDFAGNQRVYLSFPEAGSNGTSGATVGYGRLILGSGQPRIEGYRTIWRQQPKVRGGNHYSERIAFAPDGTMFVSSG